MVGGPTSSTDSATGIQSLGNVTAGYSSGASGEATYESSAIGADRSGGNAQRLSVRQRLPQKKAAPHATGKPSVRPEERDALRRYWEAADRNATIMQTAAEAGDDIELANAAQDLMAALDDLWRLREAREEDWRGILNFLQGVLKSQEFESLTPAQCSTFKRIVVDHLGPATADKNDISTCLQLLESAGFDPWGPISEEPEE